MDPGTAIVGVGVLITLFGYLEVIRRDLRSEIKEFHRELSGEIKDLRSDLSGEINGVRAASENAHSEIRKDLGDLEPLAERCWPFHQAVIETLGVRVIACLGKAAGNLVRRRLDAHNLVDEFVEDNKRGWKSRVHANSQGMAVVTLAHPSQVDWTAPASDPTGLVERSLRRCSTDAPRASGV